MKTVIDSANDLEKSKLLQSPDMVLKVIPQRYPFLMIDRILQQEWQKQAICQKNVTFSEEVLNGHFPQQPIYPGVLLIEMCLQTTQVMMTDLSCFMDENLVSSSPPQGLLLMVEKFQFKKPVYPGDILHICSELQSHVLGMLKARATIYCEEVEVAKGIIVVGERKSAI